MDWIHHDILRRWKLIILFHMGVFGWKAWQNICLYIWLHTQLRRDFILMIKSSSLIGSHSIQRDNISRKHHLVTPPSHRLLKSTSFNFISNIRMGVSQSKSHRMVVSLWRGMGSL